MSYVNEKSIGRYQKELKARIDELNEQINTLEDELNYLQLKRHVISRRFTQTGLPTYSKQLDKLNSDIIDKENQAEKLRWSNESEERELEFLLSILEQLAP